ncbi:MAG: protein kinase [Planctomycetes bacterium]|nr:protein kinase [Planctomycetota bacterium]
MSQDQTQDPLIGTVFGGARIQQRVSKGLLADVYMGHYERLGVPVAVKILSPKAMAQGVNKERFVREGRALAQLSHANIIKIYNVGQEQGRCFIIMDWIQDGMNLRQLAQTRPLTPAQSLKVVQRLCEALEYIHGKNLIHRDIKPANICLRRGGHPVLMDFSLIKDQSSDVQLTAPGTIMGTVNFMPPEQAQPGGPFGDVSVRSDVYSLGGTLYWLLTGKPPFKGRTPMETIIKLMREPAAAPSSFNPTLPQVVDQLVLDTLAKKQEQRPASARDLAARIEAIFQSNRGELEAAQRPAPATDDGAPAAPQPAARAASSSQGDRGWGAPAPESRPLAPIPGLAHGQPPVAAAAQPAPTGRGPAVSAPPMAAPMGAPPMGAPLGGVALAPASVADAAHHLDPAPLDPAHLDPQLDPSPVYAPTTSTEDSAAGLVRMPPELRDERRPRPAAAAAGRDGPPLPVVIGLVVVIVACISFAVAVFGFGFNPWH